MDPDPTAIDDYIRANRGTYTDEAIRDNLVSAGHDRSAVEAAFRRLGFEPSWNPLEDPGPAMTLVTAAWIMFVVGGLAGLAGFSMAASFGSGGSFPIFLVAYVGIGLGIVLLLRWAVPRFAIRGLWAGVLGVALVPIFGAVMFGTCIAAFAAGRAQ